MKNTNKKMLLKEGELLRYKGTGFLGYIKDCNEMTFIKDAAPEYPNYLWVQYRNIKMIVRPSEVEIM